MLWEVDVFPAADRPDMLARRIVAESVHLRLPGSLRIATGYGYLIETDVGPEQVRNVASRLLSDPIMERTVVGRPGDSSVSSIPESYERLVYVLPKPGVMDPVAQSVLEVLADVQVSAAAVRTFRKYFVAGVDDRATTTLAGRLLANDAIEQVVHGPLRLERLDVGTPYRFERVTVPIRAMSDDDLLRLSKQAQLYLKLVEMQTIQKHFQELRRDPTDAELETIAQTWSEHCSHKTLTGRVRYVDEKGERVFQNMLKETIFAATRQIRSELGKHDWCVSVFEDNAGVIRFHEDVHLVFKVETHNHPSAIEPYGGANTGLGGVIRDPMGTGLGARPICSTDVFCFAPPDLPAEQLPKGVLHPRRVMQGVVAGVRDYGNRMGIPTVNGGLFFDERYLGNPLVFCGNVGLLPVNRVKKSAAAGDRIVVLGGRTGRDGIHGATFSSAELTSESEQVSGGAVQIGNAITEKMLLDVVMAARDEGLFSAITDCGAGGLSSAVGEMGSEIGAEVWLDRVALKYEGLSYAEIWISEAQERMVVAVPPEHWQRLHQLAESEGVEATVIGEFQQTGQLRLLYSDQEVADLSLHFLHKGRPPVLREARYTPPKVKPWPAKPLSGGDLESALHAILGSLNVCSKEWVIRQYDHEVQAGSVLKPLVGVKNDGPGDAAVLRPVLSSRQGVVVACGMNPNYGDLDPYHMATSAIDEAIRNCVAVGADPARIAILDNFCWGDTDRPETLGTLVRAALACHDMAIALKTPFISGKDSLNNEFKYVVDGETRSIAVPPTLLISALGQVDDISRCVSMDLKGSGNLLFVVGLTREELGGSHLAKYLGIKAGKVPQAHPQTARVLFAALHRAIHAGLVRACHDLSEGGLAVALAEMAFAGGLGARLWLSAVPRSDELAAERHAEILFSESNTRFLCEVPPGHATQFGEALLGVPCAQVGEVTSSGMVEFFAEPPATATSSAPLFSGQIAQLKESWQKPLRW